MDLGDSINTFQDSIYRMNSSISCHKYPADQKAQKDLMRNMNSIIDGIDLTQYTQMSIDIGTYQSKVWQHPIRYRTTKRIWVMNVMTSSQLQWDYLTGKLLYPVDA
ncbi:TPA: hypothetical protein DCZ39_08500 [Patescibacteria group bacterium]|nr:hypothetical protein [Candidatus Gracilibacteria bacterium]